MNRMSHPLLFTIFGCLFLVCACVAEPTGDEENNTGPDPFPEGWCEPDLTGRVAAHEDVRANTDIVDYVYTLVAETGDYHVQLLGEDDVDLGTLRWHEELPTLVDDRGSELGYAGNLTATFESPNGDTVQLKVDGRNLLPGGGTRNRMELDDGDKTLHFEYDTFSGSVQRGEMFVLAEEAASRPTVGTNSHRVKVFDDGSWRILEYVGLKLKADPASDEGATEGEILTWSAEVGFTNKDAMAGLFIATSDRTWMIALFEHWADCVRHDANLEARLDELVQRELALDSEACVDSATNFISAAPFWLGCSTLWLTPPGWAACAAGLLFQIGGVLKGRRCICSAQTRIQFSRVCSKTCDPSLCMEYCRKERPLSCDPDNKWKGECNEGSGIDFTGSRCKCVSVIGDEPLCLCEEGCSSGDPHILTFDRMYYDFQAVGEFVLVETKDGSPWQVQVRQEGFYDNSCGVASNTAVATRMGDSTVAIYTGRSPSLYVDGAPVNNVGHLTAVGDAGFVSSSEGRHQLVWTSGESLSVGVWTRSMDLDVTLPDGRQGQVHGILGTYDGDRENELTLRDGTDLTYPVHRNVLRGVYASSWRVSPEESLFDYFDADYETFNPPAEGLAPPITLDDLDESERATARARCEEAGIVDPILLSACTMDVACTDDPDYLEQHAGLVEPEDRIPIIEGGGPVIIDSPIEDDQTWRPNGTDGPDYIITSSLGVTAGLTIEAGTRVQFGPDGYIEVTGGGSLNAQGSAERPVIFEGTEEGAGFWRELNFSSDNALNKLIHVIIDGAGTSDRASVVVNNVGKLTMRDTTVRNGLGDGLWMQNDAAAQGGELIGFARNVFENIESAPMRILANQIGMLDDATDYRGPQGKENGLAYIYLTQGGAITDTQTWPAANVPFRFFQNTLSIAEGATVTINPGVEMEFTSDTGLSVNGTLMANGTEDFRIGFRGVGDGTTGLWRGIQFSGSTSSITFADITGAGYLDWGIFSGGSFNVFVSENSSLTFRDNHVAHSAGWGVYIFDHNEDTSATIPADATTVNTFEGNLKGDVQYHSVCSPAGTC